MNFSSLQLVLIGLGTLLQIVAFSATRRDYSGPRPRKAAMVEAPKPPAPRINSARLRPSARSKDYYEIEATPPGVKPGELAKTAKVKYVQG